MSNILIYIQKINYKKGELDHVDQLLANLSYHIPIYTMPGLEDPSTLTFPQDPLHRVLFPKASKNPNFNSLTNPAFAALDQTK
jgi:DNA polymerase delta subunit 2